MGALVAGGLSLGVVRCPIATVLHVPCPACGSSRAVDALVHGDLAGVARWNPIAPVAVAALATLGLQTAWAAYREGSPIARLDTRAARWTVRVLLACVVLELAIWLARFAGFLGGPVPV